MEHVLYQFFQEKSIGNCLRYVRGLQVMLMNIDNVNQADSHKCFVIFSKTHMAHVLYPIF